MTNFTVSYIISKVIPSKIQAEKKDEKKNYKKYVFKVKTKPTMLYKDAKLSVFCTSGPETKVS